MEKLTTWSSLLSNSMESFSQNFSDTLPSIVGAFSIALIGWICAKILSFIVKRLLQFTRIDEIASKMQVDEMLVKANIKEKPSGIIARFVYWVILLLVIITASETLGWNLLSAEMSKLLNWLPSLFAALIFLVLGIYLARFVRDLINGATLSLGISGGRILSLVVFYFLVIMVSLSALNQAGIDTTVLSSNLLLIIGSILLAGSISYGLASRDILANVLASFFGKRVLKKGQKIAYDGLVGTVVNINSINIILKTDSDQKVVIPSLDLVKNRYMILQEPDDPKESH